ncbi:MAG: type IV pilus biogenesis/stability protein PilW [Thiolinea sp.]
MKTNNRMVAVLLAAVLLGCSGTGGSRGNADKAAEYHAQLGIGYLQRNRLGLAKEYLEKALKRNRHSPEAQHYYALLQERLGDPVKAGEYYRKALASDGKNPELLNNYGSFLCKQGEISQAEAVFLRATQDPLYKTPEFAYANAGICLKKKGELTRAEDYFRKALDLSPDFPSALFHMAELSHLQNENAKAQAFLYRYNERAGDSAESLALCYKIHTALQESVQAGQCANRLQARFPQSREARELN